MNHFLRDGAEFEKHRDLKRREFAARSSAWKRRRVEADASPLPCLWKPHAGADPARRPAHLLALFLGDFAMVRYAGSEEDSGLFLLRAGIPWEEWHAKVLERYRNGQQVPAPFRPRRRVPPAWIHAVLGWPGPERAQWFENLRASGLLPPLRKLDEAGVAPWMRWEEVRGRFLDFRPAASALESL